MVQFKEIKILPSLWTLDVVVTSSPNDAVNFLSKRFEMNILEWEDKQVLDCVCILEAGEKSKIAHQRRIVMTLASLDPDVVVHELIHVLWVAAKTIGYEMTYETQEWQATLYEYLFRETMKENFKMIKK